MGCRCAILGRSQAVAPAPSEEKAADDPKAKFDEASPEPATQGAAEGAAPAAEPDTPDPGPPRAAALSGVRLADLQALVDDNREWLETKAWNNFAQKDLRPTMYDVVDVLIKPKTKASRLSYAELLQPRAPMVFVSHWWGEEFAKFMLALTCFAKIYAEEHQLPSQGDVVFWVCSFANRQWQVNLGATLEDSPFELALQAETCTAVVMILDSEATPLCRIWCLYEVLRTHALGKTFHIATENGVMTHGDEEARGGERADFLALTQKVAKIDASSAAASVEEDRRRILQQVAASAGIAQFNIHVKGLLVDAFQKRGGKQLGTSLGGLTIELKRIDLQRKLLVAFEGRTALHQLAEEGSASEVKASLEKDSQHLSSLNALGQSPLHLAACFNPDAGAMRALLEARADANHADKNGLTPLPLAALAGQAAGISLLVEARADVQAGGVCMELPTEPMVLAAFHGHDDCIRSLLGYSCEVSVDALLVLAMFGHAQPLQLLLRARADPDKTKATSKSTVTPLSAAVVGGQVECAKLLLEFRADMHKTDHEKPLIVLATGRGHIEMTDLLLERRADIFAETSERETGFIHACGGGFDHMVTKIIGMRADPDECCKAGFFPIHAAAHWGRESTVRLLASARADVNCRNAEGETPLHRAAYFGYGSTILALMELRADQTLRDNTDWTALDLAVDDGDYPDIIELLQDLAHGRPVPGPGEAAGPRGDGQ